jgi:hypothetical protein
VKDAEPCYGCTCQRRRSRSRREQLRASRDSFWRHNFLGAIESLELSLLSEGADATKKCFHAHVIRCFGFNLDRWARPWFFPGGGGGGQRQNLLPNFSIWTVYNSESIIFWDMTPCSLSTLKMEAICSSETSIVTQRTTRRHIPENDTLHNHSCKNLKSYMFITHFVWTIHANTFYSNLNHSSVNAWRSSMTSLQTRT